MSYFDISYFDVVVMTFQGACFWGLTLLIAYAQYIGELAQTTANLN